MGKRVKFNFEIDFIKGGGINRKDFLLDIEIVHMSAIKPADYQFAYIVLLMACPVNILNKEIINEKYKKRTADKETGKEAFIYLIYAIENGPITYQARLAPVVYGFLNTENSKQFGEESTSFQIDKRDVFTNTDKYLDCLFHTILPGAKILIVEHRCNLQLLPPGSLPFSAVMPKFKGVSSFPVRAIAKIMATA